MKNILRVAGSGVLGLSMLCAVNLGMAQGAEPQWIQVDENASSTFYYDKANIDKLGKGIFRVTARVVYTPEGREETLDVLKHAKEYETLVESRFVYDLDCRQSKSLLKRVSHHDKESKTLKSFDLTGVTAWEEIRPAERLELITDEECAKK
jgi:hypothetical protein